MRRFWRGASALVVVLAVSGAALFAQAPAPLDQFVPVSPSELHQDQIPAARLVFTAYAFVWVVFVVYLFLLWRRMQRVDAELQALKTKLERSPR